LAGFQVTIIGRFWVTTEGPATQNAAQSRRTVARHIRFAVDDNLIEKSPIRNRHKPVVANREKPV